MALNESQLPPADHYQYLQFCEAFKWRNNPSDSHNANMMPSTSEQLVDLFPQTSLGRIGSTLMDHLTHHSTDSLPMILFTIIFRMNNALIQSPRASASIRDHVYSILNDMFSLLNLADYSSKPNVLRNYHFYLFSLIADNLISESAKVNYLQQLSLNRIANAAILTAPLLKEEQQIIERYSTIPLARHINFLLFPLLKQQVQADHPTVLDTSKDMIDNPLAVRINVFCQLFDNHLNDYLKTNQLFGAKIKAQENPSFIAVLLHCLITDALNYYQLNGTEFDRCIGTTMQTIKEDFREHALHQQLLHQPIACGFKEALANRLNGFSTAASLSNIVDLSILPEFGALRPEPEPESWTYRILPAAALIVEAVHVGLPIVLAITGVGIPAALGSGAAIAGLRSALTATYNAAHWLHETLEHHSWDDIIVGFAHMRHLAHDAGFFSHEEHTESPMVRVDVLRHFNDLLTHAGPTHVDIVQALINHLAVVYAPITAELSEQSNKFLGILLVELFLRGLKVRLSVEMQVGYCIPQTPIELYDYFIETLWLYSCPRANDDMQLLTKNHQAFSALSVIFPQVMKVNTEEGTRDIKISCKFYQPLFEKPCALVRYASSYEVGLINMLRQNEIHFYPFSLANNDHVALPKQRFIKYTIAYQEARPLAEILSLLSNKDKADLIQLAIEDAHYSENPTSSGNLTRSNRLSAQALQTGGFFASSMSSLQESTEFPNTPGFSRISSPNWQ